MTQLPVALDPNILIFDQAGTTAAVIDRPTEAKLTHGLNGVRTLKIVIPESHAVRSMIQPERAIEHDGEVYRVRKMDNFRQGSTAMLEVYAEARFYDLLFNKVAAQVFTNATASTVINAVLTGTGWTAGTIQPSVTRTFELEAATVLAALRQVATVYGVDLTFTNKTRKVNLLTFAGRKNGATFTWGKNVTESRRVIDSTSIANRIYGVNDDGLTIASANGGVDYVENLTWTTEIRATTYNFKSGTTAATMKMLCDMALGKRYKPKVSYELSLIDTSAWSNQTLDQFDAGDEIYVVDEEFAIRSLERVSEIERDLVLPWNSKITLADKLDGPGWYPSNLPLSTETMNYIDSAMPGLLGDNLPTALNEALPDALKNQGIVITVDHGSNASTPRPDTPNGGKVYWTGSATVQPANMAQGDFWYDGRP